MRFFAKKENIISKYALITEQVIMKIESCKTHSIWIPAGNASLRSDLTIPAGARGLILFAQGGGGRLDPKNQHVSSKFVELGLATLLIDLLTEEEEQEDLSTGLLRFDIDMLADRLVDVIDWISVRDETTGLNIGIFSAGTGSAASIVASVRRDKWIHALVSRGGRPDLAGGRLAELACPTLLIVGGDEQDAVKLNKSAFEQMQCPKAMVFIQGATHEFEHPGALNEVSEHAVQWFTQHLI